MSRGLIHARRVQIRGGQLTSPSDRHLLKDELGKFEAKECVLLVFEGPTHGAFLQEIVNAVSLRLQALAEQGRVAATGADR